MTVVLICEIILRRSQSAATKFGMAHPLEQLRDDALREIESRAQQFQSATESGALSKIDISLPGTPREIGALHPLTQMWERSIEIFRRMGFALADGPDIEDEWHCFDALNTPPEHPARNE